MILFPESRAVSEFLHAEANLPRLKYTVMIQTSILSGKKGFFLYLWVAELQFGHLLVVLPDKVSGILLPCCGNLVIIAGHLNVYSFAPENILKLQTVTCHSYYFTLRDPPWELQQTCCRFGFNGSFMSRPFFWTSSLRSRFGCCCKDGFYYILREY